MAKNCFSLEKISRIRDGVSMYPAFPTLHNSRQTVIGSRTSSRRCEQTTKSNVLSRNGQGELHTSCTIQVSALKRSSSSGSRASSTRRELVGIQVDDMGGEIERSVPSARIEDARRPPSNLSQLRQVRTQDHRSFGKEASGPTIRICPSKGVVNLNNLVKSGRSNAGSGPTRPPPLPSPHGPWLRYAVLWNAFKRVAAGYSADEKVKPFSGRQSASTVSPNVSHHAEFVDDHPFGISDWGYSIRPQGIT